MPVFVWNYEGLDSQPSSMGFYGMSIELMAHYVKITSLLMHVGLTQTMMQRIVSKLIFPGTTRHELVELVHSDQTGGALSGFCGFADGQSHFSEHTIVQIYGFTTPMQTTNRGVYNINS